MYIISNILLLIVTAKNKNKGEKKNEREYKRLLILSSVSDNY